MVDRPPKQKSYHQGAKLIDLISVEKIQINHKSLKNIFLNRRSHREFLQKPLSFEELSFLLWATQGVSGKNENLRTTPSAGAWHPFETYIQVHNVSELKPGLYRYLPLEHKLVLIKEWLNVDGMIECCLGTTFCRWVCSNIYLDGDSI